MTNHVGSFPPKNNSTNQIQETGPGRVDHKTNCTFLNISTAGIDVYADWQIGPHS